MRHLKSPFAIVSVYRDQRPANVNMANHIDLVDSLKKASIPHKEVFGVYQGSQERSILIVGPGCNLVADSIAREFKQDCYLAVDQDRNASLEYPNGKSERVGVFTRTATVEGKDSYTVDPDTGEKWACI